MPIEAVHILLINLATDSLPAVALGVDPASPNVMKHKPVKSGTLFEKGMIYRIALHGLFISAAAWAAYLIGTYCFAHDHVQAMTMTFIVLSVSQLSHALNQRSNTESIFKPGQGHNKFLALALLVSAAIVALVVFVPPLQRLLQPHQPDLAGVAGQPRALPVPPRRGRDLQDLHPPLQAPPPRPDAAPPRQIQRPPRPRRRTAARAEGRKEAAPPCTAGRAFLVFFV